MEARVDEWVESQVIKYNDSKWGNKLSTKNFLVRFWEGPRHEIGSISMVVMHIPKQPLL